MCNSLSSKYFASHIDAKKVNLDSPYACLLHSLFNDAFSNI